MLYLLLVKCLVIIFKYIHTLYIAPPYDILFMVDFEEKMLESFEKKQMIW